MLALIMPVRSRQTVGDWSAYSSLVNRGLASLTRQTCDAYRVVVVCDQLPDGALQHPKVDYIRLPGQVPAAPSWGEAEADKTARLSLGAQYCQEFRPTHVMAVDCDDLVSRELAAFVACAPDADGWYVDQGYIWPNRSRLVYRRTHGFNQVCGTSLITRVELFAQVFQDSQLAFEWAPVPTGGQWFDHRLRDFGPAGSLSALPFPGAVYCVFHGWNVRADALLAERTRAVGGRLRLYAEQARKTQPRWVSAGFEREFGLRA